MISTFFTPCINISSFRPSIGPTISPIENVSIYTNNPYTPEIIIAIVFGYILFVIVVICINIYYCYKNECETFMQQIPR